MAAPDIRVTMNGDTRVTMNGDTRVTMGAAIGPQSKVSAGLKLQRSIGSVGLNLQRKASASLGATTKVQADL